MSETQQLSSQVIYSFFYVTGGDDKGPDTLSVKRLGKWQRGRSSKRKQVQNSSGVDFLGCKAGMRGLP